MLQNNGTLNQRVQGSNPCTPTNDFNDLGATSLWVASQKSRLGSTWEAGEYRRRRRSATKTSLIGWRCSAQGTDGRCGARRPEDHSAPWGAAATSPLNIEGFD